MTKIGENCKTVFAKIFVPERPERPERPGRPERRDPQPAPLQRGTCVYKTHSLPRPRGGRVSIFK